MKQPKCPNCGSENVVLSADLDGVKFWIDENGKVDFEFEEIRDKLWDVLLKFDYVGCECADCGEHWDYEDRFN